MSLQADAAQSPDYLDIDAETVIVNDLTWHYSAQTFVHPMGTAYRKPIDPCGLNGCPQVEFGGDYQLTTMIEPFTITQSGGSSPVIGVDLFYLRYDPQDTIDFSRSFVRIHWLLEGPTEQASGSYITPTFIGPPTFFQGTEAEMHFGRHQDGTIYNLSLDLEANTQQGILDVVTVDGIPWRIRDIYNPVLAGDFDLDGDLDGRDFLTWQRNLQIGDMHDWEENFSGSQTATILAVPEPGTTVLAVVGIYFFVFLRVAEVRGGRG